MKTLVIIADSAALEKKYPKENYEKNEGFKHLEESFLKVCASGVGIVGLEINNQTTKIFKIIEEMCFKTKRHISKNLFEL